MLCTYSVESRRVGEVKTWEDNFGETKSYDIEDFYDQLEKLDSLVSSGVEALFSYPPSAWCRSFFSISRKSDYLENNVWSI